MTAAPTGGVDHRRVRARRDFLAIAAVLDPLVERASVSTPLGRRPRLLWDGPLADGWAARYAALGDPPPGSAKSDLVGLIDHLAGRQVADARNELRRLVDHVATGGQLVVVERVVRGEGGPAMGLRDLLALVSEASGTRVTLNDVRSLRRDAKTHPNTAVLSFTVLGPATPEEDA